MLNTDGLVLKTFKVVETEFKEEDIMVWQNIRVLTVLYNMMGA